MNIIKARNFPLFFFNGERKKVFVGLDLKKFIAVAIFVTFFLVGLLFYLWPNVELVRNGFQYNSLMAQKDRLIEENKAFRLEISSLKSIDRVELIAREKLGMTVPGEGQLFYVKIDTGFKKTP